MPALRLRERLPSTFVCQRMFGKVNLVEDPGVRAGERLGSDPLDADADWFLERFEGRKVGVRAALMNQKVLANIGNTYSGETLLQAQLHPRASVAHLDAPILGKLRTEVRPLLKVTIEWEANPHKITDFVLLSQRHEGEKCPQGNGEIWKIKAAGRTYYCLSTEGEVTRK